MCRSTNELRPTEIKSDFDKERFEKPLNWFYLTKKSKQRKNNQVVTLVKAEWLNNEGFHPRAWKYAFLASIFVPASTILVQLTWRSHFMETIKIDGLVMRLLSEDICCVVIRWRSSTWVLKNQVKFTAKFWHFLCTKWEKTKERGNSRSRTLRRWN